MKKFLSLLLTLLMLLSVTACGGDKTTTPPPAKDPASEAQKKEDPREEEPQTVFDFGAYVVEFKEAALVEADYGFDCLMLTLAYTNIDPEETGALSENIRCKAFQNGEEMSPGNFSEYWKDEPYYVRDGAVVDFHIGYILQLEDNRVYYDMSEIEVILQDQNSDLSYSFTVDPSALDDSAIKDAAAPGGTESFGDFTSILVPEGFTLKHNSQNENDPHFVSVVSTDADWIYFNFRNYTYEEDMQEEYEYLKENYTNGQTDVSTNYGGIDWTAFQCDDGNGGCKFYASAVIGDNYLLVSSAGLEFDDGIVKAVLCSVVMAGSSGGADSVDMTGVDRTDTEVGGGYHGSIDWLHYWTGDWYGWWMVSDGTGLYAEWNDGTGGGVWDACARIEAYESMTGYMELWDSSGSDADPVAGIDVCFANPDDTEFGVMGCNGGQFIGDTLEEGAWYIDPDEFIYENIIDFEGDYEDEDGTFYYRVLLRPWGIKWDDMDESLYPEQYYYDWYLPLVEAGSAMPDHIG